jgi:hypothetical protein
MRYRLRTLLIVLALGPPVLAGGWMLYQDWQGRREREKWFEFYGDTHPRAEFMPQPVPSFATPDENRSPLPRR